MKRFLLKLLSASIFFVLGFVVASSLAASFFSSDAYGRSIAFIAGTNYYRGCVDASAVTVSSGVSFCQEGALNAGAEVYEMIMKSSR